MASLKEKYGKKVKFYFVEYNQPEAQQVIQKFNIESHPQTFILDKDDNLVFESKGYNEELNDLGKIDSQIKELVK